MLMDVDMYVRVWNSYRENRSTFHEAETAHKLEVDQNARAAIASLFFGKEKDNDTRKAGCFKLEHMPDKDFVTKFIPNLTRYVKDCMSAAMSQRMV